jgi:putative addiction module killer protein
MEIKKHPKFDEFFEELIDEKVKGAITARLTRMAMGLFGDCAPVGDGVWEARIHLGKGWRIYYVKIGSQVTLLLGGGEKNGQQRDIEAAKDRAKQLKLK